MMHFYYSLLIFYFINVDVILDLRKLTYILINFISLEIYKI